MEVLEKTAAELNNQTTLLSEMQSIMQTEFKAVEILISEHETMKKRIAKWDKAREKEKRLEREAKRNQIKTSDIPLFKLLSPSMTRPTITTIDRRSLSVAPDSVDVSFATNRMMI